MEASDFPQLTPDEFRKLRIVEANHSGSGVLPDLFNRALEHVAASTPAAAVADIGATTDLVGVDGSGSNAAPLAGTESRLDVVEAKVDELVGSLRSANHIAT